jgi:hypothetical protein
VLGRRQLGRHGLGPGLCTLNDSFPARSGDDATLVFASPSGSDPPTTKAEIADYLEEVRALPAVTGPRIAYDQPEQVSPRGVAFTTVTSDGADATIESSVALMQELAAPLRAGGVTTEFRRRVVPDRRRPQLRGLQLLAGVSLRPVRRPASSKRRP